MQQPSNKPFKAPPKTKLQQRQAAHARAMSRLRENRVEIAAKFRSETMRLLKAGPEAAAIELNHRCPFCDALIIPRIEVFCPFGEPRQYFVWPDKCGCEAEANGLKEQAVKQQLTQAQLLEQKRQAQLHRAGLIGWLADADFDQFQPREDWPEAMGKKAQAMAYFDALENDTFEVVSHPIFRPHKKNWLIMHGHYGNGKTLLAAAMVKWFTGNGSAFFRVFPDYDRRIRSTFGKDKDGNARSTETENDIIEELQKGEFVVIDDLDKRQSTEFTRGVLYSVLNYRYNAELPTVLTFNFGPDEVDKNAPGRLALEAILGPSVLDRIIGSAFDIIEFNGPSYRSGVTW